MMARDGGRSLDIVAQHVDPGRWNRSPRITAATASVIAAICFWPDSTLWNGTSWKFSTIRASAPPYRPGGGIPSREAQHPREIKSIATARRARQRRQVNDGRRYVVSRWLTSP